jgi:hypothetical protein
MGSDRDFLISVIILATIYGAAIIALWEIAKWLFQAIF